MNILVRDSEPEDTLTNVGFKLGRWLDTVIMQCPLNGG